MSDAPILDDGSRRAPAGRVVGLLGSAVAVTVAAMLTGCGDYSKADASSALVSALSTATGLSGNIDKTAFATCIVNKLYDSGSFTNDEIQKLVKAQKPSDVDQALTDKYTAKVTTPCAQQVVDAGSSSSTSAASSSATSSAST